MAEKVIQLITAKHKTAIRTVDVVVASGTLTKTVTFEKPFRAAPEVMGIARRDTNAAQAVVPNVSGVSATQLTVTLDANAGTDHTYKVLISGEYAN